MIAVIFEVQPSSNGRQAYLDLAADLRAREFYEKPTAERKR